MSASLNLRKAALTLHSLNASDKKWILDRVLESEKALLEPLLDELKHIGLTQSLPFDLDSELSQNVAESATSEISTHTKDNFIKVIDDLPFHIIEEVLKGESLVVIARLLSINDWQWCDVYLNSLTTLEKRQLERLHATPTNKRNLNQFDRHLCSLIIARSRAVDQGRRTRSPTFIQRVFQGFTK